GRLPISLSYSPSTCFTIKYSKRICSNWPSSIITRKSAFKASYPAKDTNTTGDLQHIAINLLMAQARHQLICINWSSKRNKFNISEVIKQYLHLWWYRQLIR
ncbi:hypothetical protein T310_10174, partial [Rasamsonia emersonii CBS 393.64]